MAEIGAALNILLCTTPGTIPNHLAPENSHVNSRVPDISNEAMPVSFFREEHAKTETSDYIQIIVFPPFESWIVH